MVVIKGDLRASYDLVPIEKYYLVGGLNPFSRRIDAPFAVLQFERGCRAHCTFCSVRDFVGRGVRHRAVEDVLAEMTFLVEERGIRHFELLDDDPNFHREAFKAVLRAIIARKWPIRWSTNNGFIAAALDEETLELMRQSNCIGFKVGIESGNEEIFAKIRKPGKLYKFLALSERLEKFPELFVGGNYIIGLPGETFGQMMDTFRFALEVKYDWAAMVVCQAIRGATAFSELGEYFEHQMKTEGTEVKNFMPARESKLGHLSDSSGVLRNLDVFKLGSSLVPCEDQCREIWFTFNLMANYVSNKNLRPGGYPEKFIDWVQAAMRAYPTNPYMKMFIGFAYRLLGDDIQADACHEAAQRFCNSDYWRDRFSAFFLDRLLAEKPASPEQVYAGVERIWQLQQTMCANWLALPRGLVPVPGSPPNTTVALSESGQSCA